MCIIIGLSLNALACRFARSYVMEYKLLCRLYSYTNRLGKWVNIFLVQQVIK